MLLLLGDIDLVVEILNSRTSTEKKAFMQCCIEYQHDAN